MRAIAVQKYLPLTFLLLCLLSVKAWSQGCNAFNFQWQADIPSACNQMTMTMAHDALNRPYLYVANKEAGLKIYDINVPGNPVLVKTIPVTDFGSLDVMNLSQEGNYLYLATGNHFNNNQNSGMAIVDVSSPASASVTGYYALPNSQGGAGIVRTEGNYAYLGAMVNGLVVLDISNKSNITFVSQFKPDINYPTPNPNPALYNARGMVVKNDVVYLCYDAGGVRIINVANKQQPIETGRYSNPLLNGHPRAYNNAVLYGSLLYLTFDYCGIEILNVADTSHLTLTGKWNPYNCPSNNWFNTPVHANEIAYNAACKALFISTGKSDMYVLDVSDPAQPDSCNFYGGVNNNIGTWGISTWQNQVYLSYICAAVPFASNWTGVKILTYTPCPAAVQHPGEYSDILLYPVPTKDEMTLELGIGLPYNQSWLYVTDVYGKKCMDLQFTSRYYTLDLKSFPAGIYFLHVNAGDTTFRRKIVKL